MNNEDLNLALQETDFFDFSNPEIQKFVNKANQNCHTDLEKALKLYLLVRDGWKYNPFNISFRKEKWIASNLINETEGHCLDKAVLLITFARASGIPARLHLAKVTNHIAVGKLTKKLGTNVLTPHGYVELFLKNKWVKATPAFNKELCKMLKVAPLEFDGKNDSVFQQFNENGDQFMEYLEEYGAFNNLPLDFIVKNIKEHYPILLDKYSGYLNLSED